MRLESDQLRSNAARLKSAIGSHQLALRRTAGSAPAHIGSGASACTRMRACVCASQPGCTAHRRKFHRAPAVAVLRKSAQWGEAKAELNVHIALRRRSHHR